uniref:Protein kinase domain-containing protein n=1 Tax=Heterorhabditis bacteriophora TaxID=37862 RepID=A0A1I7WAX3_HETBA
MNGLSLFCMILSEEGEYSGSYDTGRTIGQGSFGRVAVSRRRRDGLETVTKFIFISQVLSESWISSPKRKGKMIPIEIHLLEELDHPNIIKEVYSMGYTHASYKCAEKNNVAGQHPINYCSLRTHTKRDHKEAIQQTTRSCKQWTTGYLSFLFS